MIGRQNAKLRLIVHRRVHRVNQNQARPPGLGYTNVLYLLKCLKRIGFPMYQNGSKAASGGAFSDSASALHSSCAYRADSFLLTQENTPFRGVCMQEFAELDRLR
ncbi:MAG TPA: hypothetical protein VG893_12465 [Terracidiphilus sp.]|nr:hypothetical protein [Terracidiphilus sp.]